MPVAPQSIRAFQDSACRPPNHDGARGTDRNYREDLNRLDPHMAVVAHEPEGVSQHAAAWSLGKSGSAPTRFNIVPSTARAHGGRALRGASRPWSRRVRYGAGRRAPRLPAVGRTSSAGAHGLDCRRRPDVRGRRRAARRDPQLRQPLLRSLADDGYATSKLIGGGNLGYRRNAEL